MLGTCLDLQAMHIKDSMPILDLFYSNSGTFNATIQFIIALLSILFIYSIYKNCKQLSINGIPVLPLIFIPVYMAGSSLFPFPNTIFPIFANCIILTALGPLLAIILWRNKSLTNFRILSLF